MKSYVLMAPGHVECREEPSPSPGPGEVLLNIRSALTCGTDLKTYRRGHPKIPLPSPFGHEFSGTVAAVGEGVSSFRPGDAVMAVHTAPCGSCLDCAEGFENLCTQLMETKVLGAFSEQILLPAHIVTTNLYPKPEHLGFSEAAFLEPLSCVVYGDMVQPLRPGGSLLILGAGPIGLLFLLLAKARGVSTIVVAGRREQRLRLARELGATAVIDTGAEDLRRQLERMTQGRGMEQIVECTGDPAVWESSLGLIRKGGRILLFGGCPAGSRACFDTTRLHYDQIRLDGVFHFTPEAVRRARELLIDRTIDVRPLISGSYPLGRLSEVLDLLLEGRGLKYALHPQEAP